VKQYAASVERTGVVSAAPRLAPEAHLRVLEVVVAACLEMLRRSWEGWTISLDYLLWALELASVQTLATYFSIAIQERRSRTSDAEVVGFHYETTGPRSPGHLGLYFGNGRAGLPGEGVGLRRIHSSMVVVTRTQCSQQLLPRHQRLGPAKIWERVQSSAGA
jgi:hypothetical protein